MSLWDYKILDLIVKEGNLRKAAESMHLTPAAVSHSLAKLEKEFGLPLFVRGRRSMELTQYGKMLFATYTHNTGRGHAPALRTSAYQR